MKKVKDLNNSYLQSKSEANHSGKIVIFPNQIVKITKNCKLQIVEFSGLGEIKNEDGNLLQVNSVKTGKKYIDTIDFGNIVSISCNSNTLKIFGEPLDSIKSVFAKEYQVEHCEFAMITAGNYGIQTYENS